MSKNIGISENKKNNAAANKSTYGIFFIALFAAPLLTLLTLVIFPNAPFFILPAFFFALLIFSGFAKNLIRNKIWMLLFFYGAAITVFTLPYEIIKTNFGIPFLILYYEELVRIFSTKFE